MILRLVSVLVARGIPWKNRAYFVPGFLIFVHVRP